MTQETGPAQTGGSQTIPQQEQAPGRKLGKLPAKSSPMALHFARFAMPRKALPAATKFWPRRRPFPNRTFGNTQFGDCTRAKQGIASMRMERLEVHRTPTVADAEAVRVYKEMTTRRYGADWVNDPANADTGAYEEDALADWRNPQYAMRDSKGRPLTIDAFVKIDHSDQQQLRESIATAGAHGIAVCFNLPNIFQGQDPPKRWDVQKGPDGKPILTGDGMPGSWGGHSMWARDYDQDGIWVCHTWGLDDELVTWAAVGAYMDEAHLVIDSMDTWRKKPGIKKLLDLDGIVRAVNKASDVKIAA